MFVHELQVYKDVYTLTKLIYQTVEKFPNFYKYTLGQQLCNDASQLFASIQLMCREEYQKQQKKYFERFKLTFEIIKTNLRLVHDLKVISLDKFAEISELTVKITKQVEKATLPEEHRQDLP